MPSPPSAKPSSPKLSSTYTFSVCPPDSLQFLDSPCRVQMFTKHIQGLLYDILSDRYKYELHLEVSTPEQGQHGSCGRLHYHGVIHMSEDERTIFFIEYFHKLTKHFRVEIDTITDLKKWQDYYNKDNAIMETYCKENKARHILHHKLPMPSTSKMYKTKTEKLTRSHNITDFLTESSPGF